MEVKSTTTTPSKTETPKSGWKWLEAFKKPFKKKPKPSIVENDSLDPSISINTDTPAIREQRIINQNDLEQRLDSTFGLSFSARTTLIRNEIFKGVSNVRGDKVDHIRTNSVGNLLGSAFTSSEQVGKRFLPALDETMNDLYQRIQKLPPAQRADAALNLVTVMYSLIIPIHPYSDGNGQTFREVALSYLHELGNDRFGNLFFPFKPTNTGDNTENTLTTPLTRPAANISPYSGLTNDEMRAGYYLRSGWFLDENFDIHNKLPDDHPDLKRILPDQKAKDDILVRGNEVEEWVKGLPNNPTYTGEGGNVHAYLDYILITQEGQEFIEEFILNNSVEKSRAKHKGNLTRYQESALRAFTGIRTDILNLLEPREKHLQSFEQAKAQAGQRRTV